MFEGLRNHGKILAINSYHSHFRGSDGKNC
jgi:hypothetical protein